MEDPPPAPKSDDTRRPKRRWRRRLLVILALLAAGAFWLNGPGLRWIGGMVLANLLQEAGLEGDFRIEGSLTGGVSLHELSLSGDGALQKLEAAEIRPSYRISELLDGKIRGLIVRSATVVAELESDTPDEEEENEPLDLAELPEQLRTGMLAAHRYAESLDILIDDLEVELQRDGEPVFHLARSRIARRGAATPVELSLGAITDAAGHEIEAQEFEIQWHREWIEFAPFSPLAGWAVENLTLDTRGDDHPLLAADVVVRDRRLSLALAPDFNSGSLEFRGDPLAWSEVAPGFGLETDYDFKVQRLDLRFEDIGRPPAEWEVDCDLDLVEIHWQDWAADSLVLDLTKHDREAGGKWSLSALGGEASGSFSGNWPPPDPLLEKPVPAQLTGDLEVAGLPALLDQLGERFPIPRTGAPFPGQNLAGDWQLEFRDQSPRSAQADLTISPVSDSPAPPIEISAAWSPGKTISGAINTEGVQIEASVRESDGQYTASLTLDEAAADSLRPWSAPFTDKLPGQLSVAGNCSGRGSFDPPRHEGTARIDALRWQAPDSPPLQASASATYSYPDLKLGVETLHADYEDYAVDLRADLTKQRCDVHQFTAVHGGEPLFTLDASSPLPEDPADWRSLFRLEESWKLHVATQSLDLARLASLLPEEKRPALAGSGRVSLALDGSPAAPTLTGKLQLTKAAVTDREKVPPADLTIDLKTHDGELSAEGILRLADLPAISLTAGAPLRAADWLDDPDFFDKLPVRARAEIPAIDLTKLPGMPDLKGDVSGSVNAAIDVTGTPGKPQFSGRAALQQFEYMPDDERITPVRNGTVELQLEGTRVKLAKLSAESAGGSLNGSGSMDITDFKKPAFDLRITGKALPAWRSDSIILRVNTDLRLSGSPADATLSGNIDLVQSLFFRDFELIPIGIPFTTPSEPKLPKIDAPMRRSAEAPLPSLFGDWKLDLALRTRDPFLIRGNLVQGSVTGDVRVRGTLGQPRPEGSLVVDKFEAELPLSRLKISDGRMIFRPDAPFEPALELRGRSELRPYEVNVFIGGTTADPLITLTSNPPLPQNEILTLLATGSTSSNLQSTASASSKLFQLLLEEARRGRLRYGKQLQPLLEVLSDVDLRVGEVDPYTGRDFNSVTIPLADRWLTSLSIDEEGSSRTVVIFVTRFK